MVLGTIGMWPHSAFAQIDFAGEWAPQFHEDNPERLNGTDIGDYAGLPINDAARMMANSWNADINREARWPLQKNDRKVGQSYFISNYCRD
jgi:hypothetical protein